MLCSLRFIYPLLHSEAPSPVTITHTQSRDQIHGTERDGQVDGLVRAGDALARNTERPCASSRSDCTSKQRPDSGFVHANLVSLPCTLYQSRIHTMTVTGGIQDHSGPSAGTSGGSESHRKYNLNRQMPDREIQRRPK